MRDYIVGLALGVCIGAEVISARETFDPWPWSAVILAILLVVAWYARPK